MPAERQLALQLGVSRNFTRSAGEAGQRRRAGDSRGGGDALVRRQHETRSEQNIVQTAENADGERSDYSFDILKPATPLKPVRPARRHACHRRRQRENQTLL